MNIQPSQRIQQVKEYYFSRKLKEIATLRAKGVDIISLGIGGPDLPPPASVTETMCEAVRNPANHGYQPMSAYLNCAMLLPPGISDGMA